MAMTRDGWAFISNHGQVLGCLSADPEVLVRDVAASVGISERAVLQIIRDLESAGVVTRARVGRRNQYLVCREQSLRDPLVRRVTVGQFVDLLRQGSTRWQPRPNIRLAATGSGESSPEPGDDWASARREAIAHLRNQAL